MLEYCSGAKKFSRAIDLDGLRCHICCLQTRKCNEKEKTSLESEFAYFQWSRSFQLPRFVKCKRQLKQSLQELTPSEPNPRSEREKKNRNRLFKSSIKRKTRHSHVAVGVLWRQKMNKKSVEQQVQSCCLAYSTFCFYDVLFAVAVAVVASYGLFTWRGGGGGDWGKPKGREVTHLGGVTCPRI